MKISKIVVKGLNNVLKDCKSDSRLQLVSTSGLYDSHGKEVDAEYVTLKVTSDGGIDRTHIITKIFPISIMDYTEPSIDADRYFAEDIIRWATNGKDIKSEFVNIPSFKTLLENKFGD